MRTAPLFIAVIIMGLHGHLEASDYDSFKVKRKNVFAFTQGPAIKNDRDTFTISFAVKDYCDVTVAVETPDGKIIRHLGSGVLGPNAPRPFTKNALKQVLLWDSKDDQGIYVREPGNHIIRVSLGLKPQLERIHNWHPKKRFSRGNRPLIRAAPEGVYVFEGEGADHVRMYNHNGDYVNTVYPFPSAMLDQAKGLKRAEFPQDKKKLPLKHGIVQATLLTSGPNTGHNGSCKYKPGAHTMAVQGSRIALASLRLNRLATDGSTGGLDLEGPEVLLRMLYRNREQKLPALASAFSPDGTFLYMTQYILKQSYPHPAVTLPCVTRVNFASNAKMEVFAGQPKMGVDGTGPNTFRVPTSIDCDAEGRVYVSDYMNDRIQVFTPDAKLFKTININKPTRIQIHRKSGEIFVASWMLINQYSKPGDVKKPVLYRLGSVSNPQVLTTYSLPLINHNPKVFMNRGGGHQYTFALDSWASPPVVWLVPASVGTVSKLLMARGEMKGNAEAGHIKLYAVKEKKLELLCDFGAEVKASVKRTMPPIHARQRLIVNPANGHLYVHEGQAGCAKSALSLLSINPNTGKMGELRLPFDAEDAAFDINGLIHLRTDNVIGRFDPTTWREVPFDYGAEKASVGFSSSRDGRRTPLISSLVMPAQRPGQFHQGGMSMSPKGHLVVTCFNIVVPPKRIPGMPALQAAMAIPSGTKYTPRMFPGRRRYNEVHVWDKHGQILYEDAAPGATMMDGVAMDKDDNLYLMVAANRILDGQPYFLERAETLVKTRPKHIKFMSNRKDLPVPLPKEARPKRPADMQRSRDGQVWVEGSEWLYGGVGFGGFNSAKGGGGCACWSARFALDFYARTFAPEVDHFSVAVLDTNGNLILRLGQYGNADDGKPLIAAGGSSAARSLGGDEVGLFDAAYLAVHSDKRLFIADAGNARILSVKLGYHKEETVKLRHLEQVSLKSPER